MKNKTALITGILGQDGPYLAELLVKKGYRVYGLMRKTTRQDLSNLEYLDVADDIELVTGDMTDEASLAHLVQSIRPDEVYNLAAQSFVGASWDLAKFTTDVNSLGVLYLLEAMKSFVPRSKFYQASTSELFGNNSDKGKQSEKTAFHPRSPYAVSKLYAYWMTRNFRESYSMFCCNGILFNHESPIRGKDFVTRKITDGVAKIKLGVTNELRLGNLDSKRDWGFAGDYVEAMYRMMQRTEPDDYVIATGKNHSIKEFLDAAFGAVGIKDWKKYVKIDPRFKRPAELDILKGDASKARRELKWKPKVEFDKLVSMMVKADLERTHLL